ncbi:hypothetical protein [Methylobacterium iners]|uniref:hypothetical protein n=1 Tax=Methylobacterium iners TaxID=418707 RepID=UPI001EE2487B|nr:hypothetical protein [Methylobacterium iners]
MMVLEVSEGSQDVDAGGWTDYVLISASSLAEAERQAALIVSDTLGSAPGEAYLREAYGRVVWTSSRPSGTLPEAHRLDLTSPLLTSAE